MKRDLNIVYCRLKQGVQMSRAIPVVVTEVLNSVATTSQLTHRDRFSIICLSSCLSITISCVHLLKLAISVFPVELQLQLDFLVWFLTLVLFEVDAGNQAL